jgi:hypothetical protein
MFIGVAGYGHFRDPFAGAHIACTTPDEHIGLRRLEVPAFREEVEAPKGDFLLAAGAVTLELDVPEAE